MAGYSGRRIFFLDLRTWTRIIAFYHILSSVLDINREITWLACLQREGYGQERDSALLSCQFYETVSMTGINTIPLSPNVTLSTLIETPNPIPVSIGENFTEVTITDVSEDSDPIPSSNPNSKTTFKLLNSNESNETAKVNGNRDRDDSHGRDYSTDSTFLAKFNYTEYVENAQRESRGNNSDRNRNGRRSRNIEREREMQERRRSYEEESREEELAEEKELYVWVAYFDLVIYIMQATVSAMLFYGAQKGISSMLVTWLLFNGLILGLVLLVFVYIMLTTLPSRSFFFLTVRVTADIFAFWVVAFHRRELLLHGNNRVTNNYGKGGRDIAQP